MTWWMWLVCASLGSVISVVATMLVDAIAVAAQTIEQIDAPTETTTSDLMGHVPDSEKLRAPRLSARPVTGDSTVAVSVSSQQIVPEQPYMV